MRLRNKNWLILFVSIFTLTISYAQHDWEYQHQGQSNSEEIKYWDSRFNSTKQRKFDINVPTATNSVVEQQDIVPADWYYPNLLIPQTKWIHVNARIGLYFDLNGSVSLSTAIGLSKPIHINNKQTLLPAINIAGNIYNTGVGTSSAKSKGSMRKPDFQIDAIFSPSLTYGWGGKSIVEMPLNTFHNNSQTAILNPFHNSFTLASNIVRNSNGRHQRVGYFGAKVGGRVAFGSYNDAFPLLGDGDDRYWSGVGSISVALDDSHILTLGSDIFTELRVKNPNGRTRYLRDYNNPTNGVEGTYYQSIYRKLFNNGQTYLSMQGDILNFTTRYIGVQHMRPQWFVHNKLTGNALFHCPDLESLINNNQ